MYICITNANLSLFLNQNFKRKKKGCKLCNFKQLNKIKMNSLPLLFFVHVPMSLMKTKTPVFTPLS